MTLPPFRLLRPGTLSEALDLIAQHGDEAAFYMGGTELLLLMKLGLASPSHLIDGKRCAELSELRVEDDVISIGAGVTHRRLERHRDIWRLLPSFGQLERRVANVRVRNVGTLGGNICFAEPHSDPVTLLIALGAEVELVGTRGRRTVSLDAFSLGAFTTELRPDEILARIVVSVPRHKRVGYERISFKERPDVAAAVVVGEDECAVVVGAVGPRPWRMPRAERLLSEQGPTAITAVAEAVSQDLAQTGIDDYRAHLAGVMVKRAHARAVGPAL